MSRRASEAAPCNMLHAPVRVISTRLMHAIDAHAVTTTDAGGTTLAAGGLELQGVQRTQR